MSSLPGEAIGSKFNLRFCLVCVRVIERVTPSQHSRVHAGLLSMQLGAFEVCDQIPGRMAVIS